MPDIDTPDPEHPPTPEEIDAWPSGRTAEELPHTTPKPSTGGDADDPEDAALETPIEPGDGLAQPSGGDVAS